MNKKLIVVIAFLAMITGCDNLKIKDDIFINSASLKGMVINSINGDTLTNNNLSGLINLSLPANNNYNKLVIDSTVSFEGTIIYSVLLEFPNPVYNVFGVFDEQLRPMIIDRSLNGYLDISFHNRNNKTYIKLNETFLSKDIFELNRLSIYSVDTNNVDLIFRSYTRLKTPDNEYTQRIIEFNDERIKTEVNSVKTSLLSGKGDVFLFDNDFKKYLSSSDMFSGFVRGEVKMLSYPYTNEMLSDHESAMRSAQNTDTLMKSIDADIKSYSMTLTEGWKEDSTWTISKNVRTSLFGTIYKNTVAGASICIAPIALRDSTEFYSLLPLKNIQTGKYTLRYSDKRDNGITYLQYFEYSFCDKKFLVIFEAGKSAYERNKIMYEKIINSFTIDC